MSNHTRFHVAALTEEGKRLLSRCIAFRHFYLAGGTALALQLGHRVSEDFDFFQSGQIPRALLFAVEKVFNDQSRRLQVANADELTVLVSGTKITFLAYPFPRRYPLVSWRGLKLASVAEIAAMKAYTVGRRGTLKDYVDLYAILKSRLSLTEIIRSAERKYGNSFNGRLFLEQLVYFDDVPDTRLRFLRRRVTRQTLQKFFQSEIKKIKL